MWSTASRGAVVHGSSWFGRAVSTTGIARWTTARDVASYYGSPRALSTVSTQRPLEFQDQLVIITGGAAGIGRAICQAFVKEGANVLCVDIDETEGLHCADTCAQGPGAFLFSKADLSRTSACTKIADTARKWQHGKPVAVLINNVGIQADNGKPVHLLDEATWDKVMNVNLKSYFLMSKSCLPGMLEAEKGVILNMASVQASASQVGIPAYAASKAAVLGLTRQMAMDYSSSGIRTNSVSPGSIHTPLVESLVKQDGRTIDDLAKSCPSQRIGTPGDIAEMCLFLASDRARNCTGANFTCDGGLTAMGAWDHRIGLQH